MGLVAEVERPLLLTCNVTIGSGNNLLQVRWYDSQEKLLLAYQLQPLTISHPNDNVRLVSHIDGSSIYIVKMQPHGSGCYTCAFDIFPLGEQTGKICIKLTGGSALCLLVVFFLPLSSLATWVNEILPLFFPLLRIFVPAGLYFPQGIWF